MIPRKRIWLLGSGLLGLALLYSGWQCLGPTVRKPADGFFYIRTGATYNQVLQSLSNQRIISSTFFFNRLARQLDYPDHVRPGKYEIRDGMSLFKLVRQLNAGRQTPVRLVINKIRTKEELAGKLGRQLEADSLEIIRFLLNNDSLKTFGLDTNTVITTFIPNTYEIYWNGPFAKLMKRMTDQQQKFWEGRRTAAAQAHGLTPLQVYTIASIIEEETNKKEDKGLIASVYINRLNKGMKLEADPTVKYAMRNFALKRILKGHLQYDSPYNTYQHTGLPPGPICTPGIQTIEAVLESPKTDYIFFVAKPDFSGYSNFASTYPEHLVYAKAYQRALDSLIIRKQQNSAP